MPCEEMPSLCDDCPKFSPQCATKCIVDTALTRDLELLGILAQAEEGKEEKLLVE